jgi:ATP-binding cassette subfamily G (WHITE) protein 2 (PDR)
VTVLYEGRQIFFGPAKHARNYFERIGFECPATQTTPDFLTSMTSPSERRVRAGFENTTPRTSDDFAKCWKESPERLQLLQDINDYSRAHPFGGDNHVKFALSRTLEKSVKQRQKSPYTLSYWQQVKLCMWREVQRIKNSKQSLDIYVRDICSPNLDPAVPLTMLFVNLCECLIIASIFYNLPTSTASFFKRGAVLFMMVCTPRSIPFPLFVAD